MCKEEDAQADQEANPRRDLVIITESQIMSEKDEEDQTEIEIVSEKDEEDQEARQGLIESNLTQ